MGPGSRGLWPLGRDYRVDGLAARHQSDLSIERLAICLCGARCNRAQLGLSLLAVLGLPASALCADLQFCNKTSYVLDLALALEEKDAAATRGWFRVDPGACRTVMQGATQSAKATSTRARSRPTAPPRSRRWDTRISASPTAIS